MTRQATQPSRLLPILTTHRRYRRGIPIPVLLLYLLTERIWSEVPLFPEALSLRHNLCLKLASSRHQAARCSVSPAGDSRVVVLVKEARRCLRSVAHIHLLVDVANVHLHGILGQVKPVGDDLVLRSLAKQVEDLYLARRQRRHFTLADGKSVGAVGDHGVAFERFCRSRPGNRGELAEKGSGKMLPALHEEINRSHENVEPQIKRQHAIDDTHPHQLLQRLLKLVDGFDDKCNWGIRMLFADGRRTL